MSCGAILSAQDQTPLSAILSFEAPQSGSAPNGWSANPPGSIFLDDKVVHGGRWSVRIERKLDTAEQFSGILKSIPIDFAGKTIELRGFVRSEAVSDFFALWIREDGDSGPVAFQSLQPQHINGTHDWTEYSISIPVHEEARRLFFGFLVSGTGKGWVDDMQLRVDGKAVWDAPKAERPKTVLDTDREFDGGSKIQITELSPVQIRNLAALGKVWGFLKYHHPRVTSGERHWDYDLFRILPAVLEARDAAAGAAAIAKWVASLGPIGECHPCASLDETELQLHPDISWINSTPQLAAIYRNRPASGKQFYLSRTPGIGNPVFEHEPAYMAVKLPDAGFQLLALYRFWNIIEYWFPYRDLLDRKWDSVLSEFIPRIALAKTSQQYQLELMALIAQVHDTHANLWSSLQVRPPVGRCQIPVIVRFIENRPVIAAYADAAAGAVSGLKVGDVIESLDGIPVSQLIERRKPYYAASNETTVLRDMARGFTQGDCGDSRLRVRRGGESFELTMKRVGVASGSGANTHDLSGETFRRLSNDIAYLKLSSVKIAEAANYVDRAAGAKGLIIDIRNYPSEFVVFAIGSLLVEKETPFARFTIGDPSNPGAFHFGPPVSLTPGRPHFNGKIAILVDEVSLSQAEYTAMAFRSAPNAFVVGSTTAGADGNVSQISLPGGLRSMISGIGVFYPDKRPTQRVGIIPDVEVKPTIAGIRAGRDEVLEAAIRRILGPDVPASEIEKLAKGSTP